MRDRAHDARVHVVHARDVRFRDARAHDARSGVLHLRRVDACRTVPASVPCLYIGSVFHRSFDPLSFHRRHIIRSLYFDIGILQNTN